VSSQILSDYATLVETLYTAGARNFLVFGVPPTQRTPYVTAMGTAAVAEIGADVNVWNVALATWNATFTSQYPDAEVVVYDAYTFFNTLLNSPTTYGFKDTTTYCSSYSAVTNDPGISVAACTYPLSEFFWWNSYHPTWPVHQLLAADIASYINSGNISSIATPTTTSSVTGAATTSKSRTATSTKTATATATATATTTGTSTSGAINTMNRLVQVFGLVVTAVTMVLLL